MSDLFQQALQHHRQGELQQAAEFYQQVLKHEPQNADAMHLFGVLLHQAGQHEQALALIQRALQIQPDQPIFLSNLSNVLRVMGRIDESVACCDRALAVQPGLFEAQLNKGLAYLAGQRSADAEATFRQALVQHPEDVRLHCALGESLNQRGRHGEALAAFTSAVERQPDAAAARSGLGTTLLILGDVERAYPHFQRTVELLPKSAAALGNAARCLVELGRIKEALARYDDAMQLDPNVPSICLNIGQAWLEAGEPDESAGWFNRVLRMQPANGAALAGQADVIAATGNWPEATRQYLQIIQRFPQCSEAFVGLVRAYRAQAELSQALAAAQKLGALPTSTAAHIAEYGDLLTIVGDKSAAESAYRQALAKNTRCTPALAGLATLIPKQITAAEQHQMESLLPQIVHADHRAQLALGLAHVHDARKEHARAAFLLQQANPWRTEHWRQRGQGPDAKAHARLVNENIGAFGAEFFTRTQGFGVETRRPAFVVAPPSCDVFGLVSLLTAHPQVGQAGGKHIAQQALAFLPHVMNEETTPIACLQRVSAEAVQSCAQWCLEQMDRIDSARKMRTIDSSASNYLTLGWVLTMFPDARIIIHRSDPRDVALSAFADHRSVHRWAFDLAEISRRFQDYYRILSDWRKISPQSFVEYRPDRLASDAAKTAKQLIQAMGLPWSEIVTPAAEALARAIAERPLHWRNYEAMLDPLTRSLPADELC